jgi:hypothetical protein
VEHIGLDALFPDMPTKSANLVIVEPNEHSPVTRSIVGPWLSLIQDQLESEQAHLNYKRPALLLMGPVQREA